MPAQEYLQAFETAVKYLTLRARSSQEVYDKLAKQGFSPDVIRQVSERLKELNYVDDGQFAMLLVMKRKTIRLGGRQLLKKELLDKGIDNNLIDEILDNEYPINEEIEIGKKVAAKKWEDILKKRAKSPRQKLVNYLRSKGFSWECINEVYHQMQIED